MGETTRGFWEVARIAGTEDWDEENGINGKIKKGNLKDHCVG